MVVERTSTVGAGQSGAIGVLMPQSITFAELFTGTPQYYPGSLIQVQETIRINSIVVEPSLVGVSKEWFQPKLRLGTYQLFTDPLDTAIREGDDGYITNEIFEISRYSWYTITANPNTAFAKYEQISLQSCNFYLEPDVYLFPGENTPVTGFRAKDLPPQWLGSSTLSKAPLADTDFFRRVTGVGLYYKPGVENVNVVYRAAIINDIYTDYEAAPVPTCQFITGSCEDLWLAQLAASGTFATQAEAIASPNYGGAVYTYQWVCPNDPTFTRTGYIPGGN